MLTFDPLKIDSKEFIFIILVKFWAKLEKILSVFNSMMEQRRMFWKSVNRKILAGEFGAKVEAALAGCS